MQRGYVTAALGAALLVASAVDAYPACTYSVADDAVKVEWTAFKLTSKVGVSGGFNQTKLSGPKSAASLSALAQGLTMEIDGSTIESGNPARNATISEFFFQKFQPPSKISGAVTKVDGDDRAGTLHVQISMNGTERVVPFRYTISPEHAVEATATIDMMDFALQSAFDTLHLACEEQHTGEDGISKTWTEVGLKLSGRFAESCE